MDPALGTKTPAFVEYLESIGEELDGDE